MSNDDAPDVPESITAAAAAGDIAGFRRLFEIYFEPLVRYAYRYLHSVDDARDLVHDVFFRVWRDRRRIGIQRDLRTYLYATVRNRALDRLKRQRIEERWVARQDADAVVEGDSTADDIVAAMQQAVDMLPPRQREVLELRWERGLSYDEVART